MFGSYLVELILGLCFLFAVLGIVTSAITEIALTLAGIRAAHLQEWLSQWTGQLLKGAAPAGAAAGFSLEALMQHPLVASQRRDGAQASYLTPEHLAAAFLQTLAMPFGSSCLGKDLASAEAGLRAHIATVQPAPLRAALDALLNNACGKAADGTALVDRLRDETVHWLDQSMSRIEGWTKRRAKAISMVAALAVCVAFNVNVLEVLKVLSSDPEVRSEMARSAVTFVEKDCGASATPAEGAGSAPAAASAPAASASAVAARVACLRESAQAAIGALGPLSRLGIGWDKPPLFLTAAPHDPAVATAEAPQRVRSFLLWLIGVACAALAASLGGDFWFKWIGDIVRLTGYKPARPEPAPPRQEPTPVRR